MANQERVGKAIERPRAGVHRSWDASSNLCSVQAADAAYHFDRAQVTATGDPFRWRPLFGVVDVLHAAKTGATHTERH